MNVKMVGLIAIVAGATLGSAFLSVWYVEASNTLTLQTTTSMNDTGFLEKIKQALIDQKTGINLRWISAGTGAALVAAGEGNADLVIVHSATYEQNFTDHTNTFAAWSGKGIARVNFAYNYFVIVGPTADPADVNGTDSRTNGTKGFLKIINYIGNGGTATFASRADTSGTYTKETQTWDAAGLYNVSLGGTKFTYANDVQKKSWHKNLGQGMGDTLIYANNEEAYTLTDYGTWLKFRKDLTNLAILSSLQPVDMKNTYSIIACDPVKLPYVKFELVQKFYKWFLNETEGGMKVLDDYKIDGENVFTKSLKCVCTCGQKDRCMAENGWMKDNFPSIPSCSGTISIAGY